MSLKAILDNDFHNYVTEDLLKTDMSTEIKKSLKIADHLPRKTEDIFNCSKEIWSIW